VEKYPHVGRADHERTAPAARPSWQHVVWLLASALLLLAILALWTQSAAAQTARGEDTLRRVLALPANEVQGGALYALRCASCHGSLGTGDADRVVPSIAGQLQGYVAKQMIDVAEGDRTIPEMHRALARADLISPQAIRDVAAFVSALAPLRTPAQGDGKAVVVGEQIFLAHCSHCHGKDAQGMEAGWVPALRGQHYAYLIKQMRQAAAGHRYSMDFEASERLEALMLPDLMAIADFLSRKTATVSAKVPLKPNGLSNDSIVHKDLP